MNAFEILVAELLGAEGYWTRPSFKVGLTKDEKIRIGRRSSPRWEIDVVAYRAPEDLILAVECKSYLDSVGVDLADLQGGRYARRYKLFCEPTTREVVLGRLRSDLIEAGLCLEASTVRLALAAGRLRSPVEDIAAYFEKMGWVLFTPQWIRARLEAAAATGYSDSIAPMVTKLLLRERGKGAD